MLEHKGYKAQAEFDDRAGVFHGEVLGTRDVVTFQGLNQLISERLASAAG